MFCPNCKYEYEKDITTCPDCGEKLVEKLDEEKHPEFDMAVLTDVNNEIEGITLISMLEEKNVECFLRNNLLPHSRTILSTNPKVSFATVLVNNKKLEQAKEILEDFKKNIK